MAKSELQKVKVHCHAVEEPIEAGADDDGASVFVFAPVVKYRDKVLWIRIGAVPEPLAFIGARSFDKKDRDRCIGRIRIASVPEGQKPNSDTDAVEAGWIRPTWLIEWRGGESGPLLGHMLETNPKFRALLEEFNEQLAVADVMLS